MARSTDGVQKRPTTSGFNTHQAMQKHVVRPVLADDQGGQRGFCAVDVVDFCSWWQRVTKSRFCTHAMGVGQPSIQALLRSIAFGLVARTWILLRATWSAVRTFSLTEASVYASRLKRRATFLTNFGHHRRSSSLARIWSTTRNHADVQPLSQILRTGLQSVTRKRLTSNEDCMTTVRTTVRRDERDRHLAGPHTFAGTIDLDPTVGVVLITPIHELIEDRRLGSTMCFSHCRAASRQQVVVRGAAVLAALPRSA